MKPEATARCAALAALLVAGTVQAADPGTLTRADSLRGKPFADAKVVAPAAAGTKVEIVSRSGGWYQVKAGKHTGWVRMLSVRRSAAATTTAQGIAGVASGRTGTGTVVTTTGIRGLDSQALESAAFDEARVARAESLRTTRADAEAWARQAGLVVRDIPALPAAKK
ncbi:MAG: SH3 domain-containing protein [Gammaproteobacteria bacterium]